MSVSQEEFQAVLRSRPDAAHGQVLFDTCAACHGSAGGGASDGTVPAIAGQHFRVIARELVDFRHDGRWNVRMEHFTDSHHLSGAQDIADVAAYLSRLAPTRAADRGDGDHVTLGSEVYARMCAGCHGADAEGNAAKGYPRLAGQHYAYLLEQLQAGAEGGRPNLAPEHVQLLRKFESVDFIAVADFLSRVGSSP